MHCIWSNYRRGSLLVLPNNTALVVRKQVIIGAFLYSLLVVLHLGNSNSSCHIIKLVAHLLHRPLLLHHQFLPLLLPWWVPPWVASSSNISISSRCPRSPTMPNSSRSPSTFRSTQGNPRPPCRVLALQRPPLLRSTGLVAPHKECRDLHLQWMLVSVYNIMDLYVAVTGRKRSLFHF